MDENTPNPIAESNSWIELTDARKQLERLCDQETAEEVMTALRAESRDPPIGGWSREEVADALDAKEDFAVRMMEAAGSSPNALDPTVERDVRRLAEHFHEEYQQCASRRDWDQQEGTNVPFEDLPHSNRMCMLETSQAVLEKFVVTEDR